MGKSVNHLSIQELMLLTQNILQNTKTFSLFSVEGLKKLITKKKPGFSEDQIEHLKNCPDCLFDVWESYVSAKALAETVKETAFTRGGEKKIITPRVHLSLDDISSSFLVFWQKSFLLPISLTQSVSVRSEAQTTQSLNLKKQSYMTQAVYMLMVPVYKNVKVELEIASLSKGFQFSFNIKTGSKANTLARNQSASEEEIYTFLLYRHKQLLESQNTSGSSSKLVFFIEYQNNLSKNKSFVPTRVKKLSSKVVYSFYISRFSDTTSGTAHNSVSSLYDSKNYFKLLEITL